MNWLRRNVNFYFAPLSARHAWWLGVNALKLLSGRRAVAETRWSDEVERAITARMGCVAGYTFPSARCALWATMRAMGVGPGDEVVVTGFTCVAVPNAVLFTGARPVYVDVDPATLNMDPGKLEERVGPRTRVIIVQHTFGNPVDTAPILRLARRRGLYVIEDCCLALGSRDRSRPLGLAGHAAIVSFELSKTVTGGWGGVLWVTDEDLSRRLLEMASRRRFASRVEAARCSLQVALSFLLYHPRTYWAGRYLAAVLYRTGLFRVSTRREEARGQVPRGFEDRLSDAHWRVVADQLSRLDAIVDHARRAAGVYRQTLEGHGLRTFPVVSPGAEPSWSRFPFLVADRAGMKRYFGSRGIEVGQWFDSPVSGAEDLAAVGYRHGECQQAEFVSRHVVNLPVHPRVSAADVDRIARHLDAYLREHQENREFGRAVEARRRAGVAATV